MRNKYAVTIRRVCHCKQSDNENTSGGYLHGSILLVLKLHGYKMGLCIQIQKLKNPCITVKLLLSVVSKSEI